MARRLAAVISQAPGLFGTPDCGHCSSAATSASCARSSARPTSRTIRVRPAMSRADSIRQTAWTLVRGSGLTGRLREVRLGHDPADLDLRRAGHRVRAALDPLDRLVHRADLPEPEAGDELLGLGERPVDDGPLGAVEAHARALGARREALAGEHD